MASQGQGRLGQHACRAHSPCHPMATPLRSPHTRPTSASSCHRCTHTHGCERADATPPPPPCMPPRALAAMASSYGPDTHACQAWLPCCATHGHTRTVRSRGLRQGASRLGGGRGRAFDRRSRPHFEELRPLLLHAPRPVACSEHCLKEQPFLGRVRAHAASVRNAAQHMSSAHDTWTKRNVKATSSRATTRSRAVRSVTKAYQSGAPSMVGVVQRGYQYSHLRGMPRVLGVNDTISKAGWICKHGATHERMQRVRAGHGTGQQLGLLGRTCNAPSLCP